MLGLNLQKKLSRSADKAVKAFAEKFQDERGETSRHWMVERFGSEFGFAAKKKQAEAFDCWSNLFTMYTQELEWVRYMEKQAELQSDYRFLATSGIPGSANFYYEICVSVEEADSCLRDAYLESNSDSLPLTIYTWAEASELKHPDGSLVFPKLFQS